jgi:peptidoglycan/xylan/chitin deacetylase (PgdA/CDA1 family)
LLVGDSYFQLFAHVASAPSHPLMATPFPTTPAISLTPPTGSPQGCVDGQSPVAQSKAIIVSAAGQTHVAPRGVPTATPIVPPAVAHEVALTFDDGPNPVWTSQILAELQAEGMRATFFVVGVHAQRFPDLVEQEWRDGMAIGNHTLHHEPLLFAKPAGVRNSLTQAAGIIKGITHDPCLWLFRPPYGDLAANSGAANEIRGEGYTIVNWDTEGRDWTRPGVGQIVRQVVANLHPGAIILLHDGAPDTESQDRSQTVQALPQILAALKARGLASVTLPQLLRDSGQVSIVSSQPPQIGT